MRRFSLRILLIVCVFASVVIGYYRKPIASALNLNAPRAPMLEISSATEMDAALDARKAIIFAHVGWSLPSVAARDTMAEFVLQWRRDGNDPNIKFYFLDLTTGHQDAPHVGNWLASDTRLSGLPIRGSGDVVWLRNGVLQKWIPAYDASVDALISETETIFKD